MKLKQSQPSCSPLPSLCGSSEDTCYLSVDVPLGFLLHPPRSCRGSADSSKPPRSHTDPNPPNSVSLQKGFILFVSLYSFPKVRGPQGETEQPCITVELFWDACAAHPVMSQCLHPLLAGPFLSRWLNDPIGPEARGDFGPCGIWPWSSHASLKKLAPSPLPPKLGSAVINAGPASVICIRSPRR